VNRTFGEDKLAGGSDRGGRSGRRVVDDEDVPEWANEPIASGGGGGGEGMGGFGMDGTFFSSAADAEALGDLDSLEPLGQPSSATDSAPTAGIAPGGSSRFLGSTIRSDSDGIGGSDTAFAPSGDRPAWAQALVSHEEPAAPAPQITPQPDADEWYYKDLANEIQGPFTTAEMTEWYGMEYFEPSLLIRKGTVGEFAALGKVVALSPAHRAAPFTTPIPGFNPPQGGSDTSANAAAAHAAREHEVFMREQQVTLELFPFCLTALVLLQYDSMRLRACTFQQPPLGVFPFAGAPPPAAGA
jgi:hypothetical protein